MTGPSHRDALLPGPEVPARYAEVSGDSSALHLDDTAAREVGLPGVILHGLYLFGVAAHAATADDEDPRRVASISARFRAPAVPGVELEVDVEEPPDDTVDDAALRRVVRLRQAGVDVLGDTSVVLRPDPR